MKLGRNDACWCGSGKKYKFCHSAFDDKIEAFERQGVYVPERRLIKNQTQLQGIRESAKINIAVLDYVAEHIKAGITTEEINHWVYEQTVKRHGIPAPLGFQGYPKSVCTSLNEQVCHGIPSDEVVLKEGDIVNVDVSTGYQGYFSDSSRMFCIGQIPEDKRRLVETAKESLSIGLKEVKPWGLLGDMGHAINEFAKQNGYSVVRDIGGHGIGLEFHEDPWVSYVSMPGTGMLMAPGLVFTIEPMINMGVSDIYIDDENGWTAYTEDGLPSAQWEIQVAVTEDGYEILSW